MIKFKDNLSQIVKEGYRVSKNGVEVYTEVTNTEDVSDENQFTFLKPGNYDISGI